MLSEAKYIQGSCVITETQLAISNTFVTAAKVLGLGARAFDLAPALGIASNLALRLGADRLALTLANRSMQLLGTLEQTSALFRSLRFFGQQFNTHNVGAGTGWTVWGGATLVLDLGLRAVGAPKEATDVSGVAAHDLTPWGNVGFGLANIGGLIANTARQGLIRGGELTLEQNFRGERGGAIQGYTILGELEEAIRSGDKTRFADTVHQLTGSQAERGEYGIFVASGNFWGDLPSKVRNALDDIHIAEFSKERHYEAEQRRRWKEQQKAQALLEMLPWFAKT